MHHHEGSLSTAQEEGNALIFLEQEGHRTRCNQQVNEEVFSLLTVPAHHDTQRIKGTHI
jgi:beta-galactosidase beta subunit